MADRKDPRDVVVVLPDKPDADDNPEDAELNLNTVDQKVFERSVAAQVFPPSLK
jgi:hypothetical protein